MSSVYTQKEGFHQVNLIAQGNSLFCFFKFQIDMNSQQEINSLKSNKKKKKNKTYPYPYVVGNPAEYAPAR